MKLVKMFVPLLVALSLFVTPVYADRTFTANAYSQDGTADTHTFVDAQSVAFSATFVAVWNTSSTLTCYLNTGGVTPTGSASGDIVIPPNTIVRRALNDPGRLTVKTICVGGTATIHVFASDSRRPQ